MNPINLHTSHAKKRQYWLFLLMMLFIVTSCTDDDWGSSPTSGNGEVKISLSLKSSQSTEDVSDEDIFDLRVIAFETSDGTTITDVRNMLVYNNPTTSVTNKTVDFALPKGRYLMYFIANAHSRTASPEFSSDLANVTTEDGLKAVLLKYGLENDGNPPAYPFVMTSEERYDREFNANATMDILMRYTCAKVSYTLSFDNTANDVSSSFRGEKLEIRSIQFKHLATKSNLLDSINYSDQAFFNADKVLTGGAATITDFNNNTWTYTGVAYIPECVYASSDTEYAYMEITAGIVGSSTDMVYKVDIKGRPGDLTAKTTSRGTEYNIAGRFKNPGESDGLTASITITDWTLETFNISIGNTTLWLSKTKGDINSLQNDSIFYDTNATSLDFELEELVSGFVPVVVEKVSAEGRSWLRVSMNPNVNISGKTPTELKGTLQLSLKVNNLTKIIDVAYDLTPMLVVNPLEAIIDFAGSVNFTTVSFSTNLGGIRIANVSSPNIAVTPVNPNVNNGTIKIEADDHVTTQTYTFDVYPIVSGYDYLMQTVTVIVKPKITGWRIYLRVINDRAEGNKWLPPLSPASSDGWMSHSAYIYTQYGATQGSDNVWRFTGNWPGGGMTQDMSNDGWYFIDLPPTAVSAGSTTRAPKPGETLVMFAEGSDSYTRHRYPFHMEPGIPLFDFADQEGWIVYDPTTDFYEFYDDKPDVFDVEYTVYYKSDQNINPGGFRWYRNYGIANGGVHTIWSEGGGNYNILMTNVGDGYYKGTFTLKAWEHNTSKDITIQFGTGESGVLYNGNEYTDMKGKASGTFSEGMWAKGKNTPSYPALPTKQAGYYRIFYYNSNNWNPVKIHYWAIGGTPVGTAWSGVNMTKWYGNWYYYDISTSYDRVIFNNGSGQQTGDIIIDSRLSSSWGETGYYKDGVWTQTKP